MFVHCQVIPPRILAPPGYQSIGYLCDVCKTVESLYIQAGRQPQLTAAENSKGWQYWELPATDRYVIPPPPTRAQLLSYSSQAILHKFLNTVVSLFNLHKPILLHV